MTEVRYWDLAVSGRQGADYIASARVGRAKDGKLYILDVTRLPGPWTDARHKMIAVMQADPANVVQGIEIAGQQGGYFQELQRDPKLQHRAIRGINPAKVGNKEVRANVWVDGGDTFKPSPVVQTMPQLPAGKAVSEVAAHSPFRYP